METSTSKTLSSFKLTVRGKNRLLVTLLLIGIIGTFVTGKHLYGIEQFNMAVTANGKVAKDDYKFEAKYAAAYQLARNGRYQDASQLFGQLLEMTASKSQLSAVQYNLGNIFLVRGLLVNHNATAGESAEENKVKDEAQYLINQAKLAYQQSLRLDHSHLDAKYNLDRALRLLPENPVAKDDQDELGIVMGNIPSGLP
ncbi:MAG TPA: hypothetical protein VK949_05995 [Methylotenera sp.]|nr:hypothetical protein [Methylotenera sp.]